ncbi:hypothetical protein Tco_0927324, partial [Tanacetum coccineum]
ETVYKEWEDRMEKAATTASSLEVEQDSGNINRTQSMATLNESFPRGTDSGSGPRLNLLLPVLVNAARHLLTAVRHKLMLPGITSYYLIQALVEKKKVIISETSIRSDLKLDDAEGTDCLPTTTIFAELERIRYENLTQKLTFYKAHFSSQWKFLIHTILQCLSAKTTSWNEFSSTMASTIICLAINQKFNLSMYIFDNMVKNLDGGVKFLMYPRFVQVFLGKQVEGMSKHKTPSHTKKVFANMKRPYKGFSGRVTPLFSTMMVQAIEDMGEGLDLEKAKTAKAKEITSLKKRVKQLEKRRKSRTSWLRRLRKGRKIADLDADAEVTLVNETQEMNDDNLIFDTYVLEEQEIKFEKVVEDPVVSVATTTKSIPVSAADPVTTAGEVVTTASV